MCLKNLLFSVFFVNATLFLIDFSTSQRGQWGYCDPDCIQYGQRHEDQTPEMSVIEETTKNSISPTQLDTNIKCGSGLSEGKGVDPFILNIMTIECQHFPLSASIRNIIYNSVIWI